MPYLPLALAIALVAGLAAGVLTDLRSPLLTVVALSASWSMAALAYRREWPRVQLAGILGLILTAGWLHGAHAIDQALDSPLRDLLEREFGGFAIHSQDEAALGEPIVVEGRLREDAATTEAGVSLRIDVSHVWIGSTPYAAGGGISVGVGGAMHAGRAGEWYAGRVVRAPVLVRRPARYENDGLPEQERSLALRGITLVGAIKSASLVETIDRGSWWEEAAARGRHFVRASLARHVAPRDSLASAIATAILIGDRGGIDEDSERRLQQAGTYHVIAISGGNIAILAALMLGSLAWFGVRGRPAAAVTLVTLAVYAAIASGGPSVARASLTAAVYLSVHLIDQRTAPANAIGVTAAILLLATPLSLTDVGFWLTFGATIAILVSLTRAPLPASWPLRAITTVFVASCAVELALAPVGAMVFQRVTAAGLVLNFAALPAMTVVQLGAMAVVGFDLVGWQGAGEAFGSAVWIGAAVLTRSAALVDYAPWSAWRVPSPGIWLVVSYYTAVLTALCLPRQPRPWLSRTRAVLTLGAAVMFAWIVTAPQARIPARPGLLTLTMFDVGQGDAMLVTFPNGRRLIVDAGASSTAFDIGDRVIAPALRARGVMTIDYLAITHGDPDHLGGARSLVRDFLPREIWWGVPVPNHLPTSDLRAESDGIGAGWRTLLRGDRFELGGVELRVHHPPPPDWERRRVRNDDSLVIELRYGQVSMLLTGDIGREVERQLLPALDLLPTVVLKVAHHGSATSSSTVLLEHLRPAVAVIGVGRGNPYGHPVRAVLDRLLGAGAAVFRTDQEGQIDVSTDGRRTSVVTHAGRRFQTQHKVHEGHEGR